MFKANIKFNNGKHIIIKAPTRAFALALICDHKRMAFREGVRITEITMWKNKSLKGGQK